MPTPDDNRLLRMDGWPGGMNNRMRETEQSAMRDGEAIPSSQFLRRALNVDLTAEGHPQRRRGYSRRLSGYAHSLWRCREQALFYAVVNGNLYVGQKVQDMAPVWAVNRYLPMSYAYMDNRVYCTNGLNTAYYDFGGLGPWPDPAAIPETFGVAAQELQTPTAADNGDSMPFPRAQSRRDDAFAGEFVSDPHYYEPMPVGQLVCAYRGRLYVARNATLWFSMPMQADYLRSTTNFYMFAHYIDMLQGVDDGLYVADKNGVHFIGGADPFDVRQRTVYPHPVVRSAFARVPGEKFGLPFDTVPVWWCRDGVMILGLPNGEIRLLTRDRLAAPEYGFGAVSVRERDGISQIVSSLQKGGDENNMGATDTVVAEVRRNDITLDP